MNSVDVILYPTDFSEECEQAYPLACSLARDQFASLVVAHILPVDNNNEGLTEGNDVDENDPMYPVCREQFRHMATTAGDIPVKFRLKRGNAVQSILQLAREEKADLIVIASHQSSQFQRDLHQGIAESITKQTECPVMVLQHPSTSGGESSMPPDPTRMDSLPIDQSVAKKK